MQIYEQQQAIGYDSVLVEGAQAVPGLHARACSPTGRRPARPRSCTRSRAATPTTSARWQGLAAKARAAGVADPGRRTRVTGLRLSGGAVTAVETDLGTIACDHVVIAPGPWVRDFWAMLGLPDHIDVTDPGGTAAPRPAHVDLLGAAGRHARGRPGRVHHQHRRVPAGGARGLRRPAVRRHRRLADHRRDVGNLLQAGLQLRRGAGRRRAVHRRPASRRGRGRPVRPGQPRVHRRRGLHPDVDLRAGAQPQAVREAAPSLQQGAVRRHRGVHPGQLPRLRHLLRATRTSSPTPTTASR